METVRDFHWGLRSDEFIIVKGAIVIAMGPFPVLWPFPAVKVNTDDFCAVKVRRQ